MALHEGDLPYTETFLITQKALFEFHSLKCSSILNVLLVS